MIDEQGEYLTREKQESRLIHRYNQGLDLLRVDTPELGRKLLQDLLQDVMLQEKEFTSIRYGVYVSLGEYLAECQCPDLTQQIITWNHSIYYLNKSNELQEQLDTHRTMAIVLRKLGFFPKAINVNFQAFFIHHTQYIHRLQLCTTLTQQLPIMYQIAQLCFLVDDRTQFDKLSATLQEHQFQVSTLAEIKLGFDGGVVHNSTVQMLVEERQSATEKLQLNPLHTRDNALMTQQYSTTMNLNKCNFVGFLKSVLYAYRSLMVKQRKGEEDNQGVANTQIIIKVMKGSVQAPKQHKNNTTPKITKQSKRHSKDSKKMAEEEPDRPLSSLDEYIYSEPLLKQALQDYQQLLYAAKNETFTQVFVDIKPSDKQMEIQIEIPFREDETLQDVNMLAFINELEVASPYLTLVDMTESILTHYFQHDYYVDNQVQYYGPTNLRGGRVCKYLTRILVHHYQLVNLHHHHHDPFYLITMLELLYEAYSHQQAQLTHQTKKKRSKYVDYSALIITLKQQVLYLVRCENLPEQLKQHYLVRYYHINALINSDQGFFYSKLAKHCATHADQLLATHFNGKYCLPWLQSNHLHQTVLVVGERIKIIKAHHKKPTEHNIQSIDTLIETLEQTAIDLNETTQLTFQHMLEQMKGAGGGKMTPEVLTKHLAKILTLIMSLLDVEATKEDFRRLLLKIERHLYLSEFMQLVVHLPPHQDLDYVALCCLKLAMCKQVLEMDDFYKYLQIFTHVHQQQLQDEPTRGLFHFILMTLLCHQNTKKNLDAFFANTSIYQNFLKSLQGYYQHTQQQMQTILNQLIDNFEQDQDLQYFILDRINFSTQQDNIYLLHKSDMQEEEDPAKKKSQELLSAESGCDDLSGQSEEPYYMRDERRMETKFVQLSVSDPNALFLINAKKYRLTKTTKKAMKQQRISINLNAPEVQDEIKKIAKQRLKTNALVGDQNARAQQVIEQYILHQSSGVVGRSLEFLGFFMPNIYKDSHPKEIGDFLDKKVQPLLLRNGSESLKTLQAFLGKVSAVADLEQEIQHLKPNKDIHVHLHFLLGKLHQKQGQAFKALDHYQLCVCHDLTNLFFLQHLYNHYFEMASAYFAQQILIDINSPQQQPQNNSKNCFIAQKKLFALIEHVVQRDQPPLRLMREKLLVMNLLKHYERLWGIRDPCLQHKPQDHQKALQQKAYDIVVLLDSQYQQCVPRSRMELTQHGIRVHILVEKYVRRKIKTINHKNLLTHLDNLRLLGDLCSQIDKMSSQEYKQFNYILHHSIFLENGYEKYLQIEYHVSIYKFCLRFIKLLQNCTPAYQKYTKAILVNLEGFLSHLESQNTIQVASTNSYENFKALNFKQSDELLFGGLESSDDHLDTNFSFYYDRISRVLEQSFSIIAQSQSKIHKKYKYKQSPVLAQYYQAHYQQTLQGNSDLAYQTISEICIPTSADIVQIYKIYDKQGLERDPLFDKFLNNDSVFLYEKLRVLKLYSKILLERHNLDQINILLKRLAKTQIVVHEEQSFINKCFGYQFMKTSFDYYKMLTQMLEKPECDSQSMLTAAMIAYTTIKKNKICNKYIQQNQKLQDTVDNFLVLYHSLKEDIQQSDQQEVLLHKALIFFENEAKKKPKKTQ